MIHQTKIFLIQKRMILRVTYKYLLNGFRSDDLVLMTKYSGPCNSFTVQQFVSFNVYNNNVNLTVIAK
jgi:hypothetical protein